MEMQIKQFISHLSNFFIKQFMCVSMFQNCIPFSIYKPFYGENDCQYLPIFVLFCLHVQNVNTFRSITLIHWPTTSSIIRYVLNLLSYFTRFNGFVTSHQLLLCYSIPCFFLSLFSEISNCIIPQLYLLILSRYYLHSSFKIKL